MRNSIDRTYKFYIEMSRRVLTKKEFDLLEKLLIEKMTIGQVCDIYGVSGEYVDQIYERTYKKVKRVMELFAQIDTYKQELKKLKSYCKVRNFHAAKEKTKTDPLLEKVILASTFPFSRRMQGMLEVLDTHTLGKLAGIPLKDFERYRGFKLQCKKELIKFIEHENIEHLFKGFSVWKKQPIQ